MKKLFITLTLILTVSTLLCAGGIYATGASITNDTTSKATQVGLFFDNDSLIVHPDKEKILNPLVTTHFDFVFSKLFGKDGVEQVGLSYIGGAGVAIKLIEKMYIDISVGPSCFTTFGNLDGTFGLGLGGILSLSYVFSDPGLALKAGIQGQYTLLFDHDNPMMVGGFLGVGFKI